METFSFIRHGHKLDATQKRRSLEESGLTADQQQKWQDAIKSLPEGTDPEITYENVPLIEKMAQDIYEQLPEKALLIFTMANTPRTHMTADLLSMELVRIAQNSKKDINVSYVLEPLEERTEDDSISKIAREVPGVIDEWKKMQAELLEKDDSLKEYFAQSHGGKTHQKELEIFFNLVKKDMAESHSLIRTWAEHLRKQVKKVEERYDNTDRPVYFYGVGHISSLIALDVAFRGREKYESPDELPRPLSLWRADKKLIG